MQKALTLIAGFILCTSIAYGQTVGVKNNIGYKHEFGIDVIPAIVTFSGITSNVLETELQYKYRLEQGDWRIKFNLNNRPLSSQPWLVRRRLSDDVADNPVYLVNYYRPRNGVLFNVGYTRHAQFERLRFYYGLDANIGWSRSNTEVVEEYRNPVNGLMKQDQNALLSNQNIYLGITPVLGAKIPLAERLVVSVEFGLSIDQRLNPFLQVQYPDGQTLNYAIPKTDISFQRLLNDIAVSWLF